MVVARLATAVATAAAALVVVTARRLVVLVATDLEASPQLPLKARHLAPIHSSGNGSPLSTQIGVETSLRMSFSKLSSMATGAHSISTPSSY